MERFQIEIEVILNHKRVNKPPIKCSSEKDGEKIIKLLYNKILKDWEGNKLMHDSNECFCYISDREHGNTFKARVVKC